MKLIVNLDKQRHLVDLPETGEIGSVNVNGNVIKIDHRHLHSTDGMIVSVNNRLHHVDITADENILKLQLDGIDFDATVVDERMEGIQQLVNNRTARHDKAGEVRAPMPGLVVKLLAEKGDTVKKDQGVIVIEAMKMENEILAPVDGVINQIKVEPGHAVDKNEILLVIENNRS